MSFNSTMQIAFPLKEAAAHHYNFSSLVYVGKYMFVGAFRKWKAPAHDYFFAIGTLRLMWIIVLTYAALLCFLSC
jgi:hypothetical protein